MVDRCRSRTYDQIQPQNQTDVDDPEQHADERGADVDVLPGGVKEASAIEHQT